MTAPLVQISGTVVRAEGFGYGQGKRGAKLLVEMLCQSRGKGGSTFEKVYTYEIGCFGQDVDMALQLPPGTFVTVEASLTTREHNSRHYLSLMYEQMLDRQEPTTQAPAQPAPQSQPANPYDPSQFPTDDMSTPF